MVKIFKGECHTVENDLNNWIEVYHPRIVDVKQSVIHIDKEHRIELILTVFYDAKSETGKVEYRIFKHGES
jgi:hypothetical protein